MHEISIDRVPTSDCHAVKLTHESLLPWQADVGCLTDTADTLCMRHASYGGCGTLRSLRASGLAIKSLPLGEAGPPFSSGRRRKPTPSPLFIFTSLSDDHSAKGRYSGSSHFRAREAYSQRTSIVPDSFSLGCCTDALVFQNPPRVPPIWGNENKGPLNRAAN